ncbi:hypothetical protein G3480_24125 [Thiorhodococcus mannitoliphagus]|uniref:Uncharacterized protein n=1 Tax=Thiorhodococcus mannitoliphagus TaxID=329406 RepID=A0A6P1E2A3_9GAMM|nr:hypothetical protein [Thiorhodococcus mannitoliphagus]NEX23343.1 hypothetical protein [Thiorhodococcus mannitoliphagus]
MKVKEFLENFRYVAEAPEGLRRLRELVLNLAISGGLSLPDEKDSPISVSIDEIGVVRSAALESGLAKVVRGTRPLASLEKPYSIPAHWRWVNLEMLAFPLAGFAFKSSHFNAGGKGIPLIRIRDVGRDTAETYYSGPYRDEFLVSQGDYLIAMDGDFRVRAWAGSQALLNQRVTRLIHYDHSPLKFVGNDSIFMFSFA